MFDYALDPADLDSPKAGQKRGSKGKMVAAKYRDPSTGDSWSGRGLQPKWLKAALAGGKKLADFSV
jgi:DNA-binding protein H-NS